MTKKGQKRIEQRTRARQKREFYPQNSRLPPGHEPPDWNKLKGLLLEKMQLYGVDIEEAQGGNRK